MDKFWFNIVPQTNVEQIKGNEGLGCTFMYHPFGDLA
jgi:hypothetical protein